ncbi:hypothetical protein DYB34_006930 [Aphanomyces astaci]|uniref:5-oxoprolinase n=1 Tax=Aphanomyces astaci TaxID=112090 RepID=A0A397FUT2_APHAT|nr:hypothetical protein DYB34_006930 [Aphanomyces astaci]RHZ40904.1 hypothetical protein DYB31_009408 [Aphanomyces astaci]
MQRSIRVSIDRGGTFTDVYAEMGTSASDVQVKVIKLLSEDPANYPDAPREGIRRILEEFTGIPHPRNQPVDTSRLEYIRMGTTVATNALLERNGERTALVITKGFRDLLYIGNQSRPKIFDLEITSPDMLYEEVVEVNERVQLVFENDRRPTDIRGVSGDYVRVLDPLDLVDLRAQLSAVRAKGIKSVAVVLVHSYTFTQHEQQIGSLAHELGFSQISLSSEIMPMIKMVPRGFTSCADAYLTPVIKDYLHSFCSGFDSNLNDVKISFMQSDGGLTPMSSFFGNRAILSGPAGGVVGYARTTRPPRLPAPLPVIGFDMGGTSTDVSRYDGTFEHVFESVTANVPIRAPQLDIQTVAAGGGSRLFYKNQLFVVGPESVRAHPGPVCYRKNGYLSVTDANLVTGRIVPQRSTKYSLGCVVENEPLDVEGTRKAFQTLSDEINASQQTAYSVEAIASGFLRVANEAMCRPIRNLTQMRGFDITTHVLACFGGAGPQHACSIAKALGYDVVEAYYVVGGLTIWLHRMSKVYIQRYSGILSAYGLSLADSVIDKQWPASCPYVASEKPSLVAKLQSLASVVLADLKAEGFDETHSTLEYFLNLRYEGTDTALMTRAVLPAGTTVQAGLLAFDFDTAFTTKYQQEFGFLLHARSVLVDDIRVRGTFSPPSNSQSTPTTISTTSASPHATTPLYFDELNAWKPVPVYLHSEMLHTQTVVQGPAIIMQNQATVVVESEWTAEILPNGDLYLYLSAPSSALADQVHDQDVAPVVVMDPIQLSVFSHRFMGIAEQMGRTLARTSVSVNIKERLDFSCALFGPDGGLVANAPHLPVHLGAMQQAVKFQMQHWGHDIVEGDVLVSNHPQLAGGSHLPDITVMTPVFESGRIVFFVASRGHHADIGGIAPGSMPPLSKTLTEEGAAIVAFKLVDGRSGQFQEQGITDILLQKGKVDSNGRPAIGTRNLRDNLSDLKAQVAANQRGVLLMHDLIAEYSLQVVTAYMYFIQESAEKAVRNMLHTFSLAQHLPEVGSVSAEDFMDDGTRLALKITIDRRTDSAIFDFTGTGAEVYGNINAPPAVTYSAIIYCLRCLLDGDDLPLNQGCLTPIQVIFPENGSILNPSSTAAVVGGNVTTSQRVTDVIFLAFRACAASQGCMNNLTFGSSTLGGYYETIAGGAGAGPHWHGRSGVHTHMTNTRITDPEILEKRYPVLLNAFGLRQGSGGVGKFAGGEGVHRELKFLVPMTVSILSERRAFQPYVGGKNTVEVLAGDVLTILSPGGGAYGAATP